MNMDWEECCRKRITKTANPDIDMINSMVKTSKNKLESERILVMNDVTAASKLSLAYDSLRELLEALALKHGYKVYNHECYTAFLKEIIRESLKGDEFDDIRIARNAVNYYGKEISAQDAAGLIKRIYALRGFVSNLLENR